MAVTVAVAVIVAVEEISVSTKEMIVEKLKENGCRITKQRLMLIDIILENECQSCKDIYYKANQEDHTIGVATVYRMVNALEDVGAISRKNMYKIDYKDNPSEGEDGFDNGCVVVLDDETTYHLSCSMCKKIMSEGMKKCGYLKNQCIASIKLER